MRQFREAARHHDGHRPLLLKGQSVVARKLRAGNATSNANGRLRVPVLFWWTRSGAGPAIRSTTTQVSGTSGSLSAPGSGAANRVVGCVFRRAAGSQHTTARHPPHAGRRRRHIRPQPDSLPTLPSRSVAAHRIGRSRTAAHGSRRMSRVACQAKSCFDERRHAGHPQAGVCDLRAPRRAQPLRCPRNPLARNCDLRDAVQTAAM